MNDCKEKIRKLLALAQSPNEHEAKLALLRARELMAKHKLTEADFAEAREREVRKVQTEWTCGKRRDPWMLDLAAVIARYYCCTSVRSHKYGGQTQIIGFLGLDGDVDVCVEVFGYAVRFACGQVRKIREKLKGFAARIIRQECDNYGFGFADGLSEAFDRQQGEHQEWGLMMVKPKEVVEASKLLGHHKFTIAPPVGGELYRLGFQDGKEFRPAESLTAYEAKEG